MQNSVIYLNLTEIRIDGGTQQRVACQQQHIFALADAFNDSEDLDPISVMFDGCDYWLVDGFHRYFAYKSEKREIIPATMLAGTQRDAILASIAANAEHRALPRTRADKRKAVETLLLDKEWGQWSDREIARQARVDHKTVSAIRKVLNDFTENPTVGNSPPSKERKFVNKQGTVSQWTDSKELPENVPPLPFDDLLKVGDRVISSYSPNLAGEIVDLDDDVQLAKVKWDKTGTVSHHGLSDLDKVKEPGKPKPPSFDLEKHLTEVILGFVSNLDRMSSEQVRDVFVNSLDRLTEDQTKEVFQACVKRLGQYKEASKCLSA